MIAAIEELQNAGVEPDVWKIEGLDRRDDCAVVTAAQRDGRDKVGCIILGRGSNEAGIIAWLRAAAPVPGFIGFAVGRTSFWDALVALRDKKTTAREDGRDYRQPLRRVGTYLRGRAQGLTVAAKRVRGS
jgi:myo-inositol catabolism protein IolC